MDLHTKRLKIREISWPDVEKVHLLHCLPQTNQYNTLGIPESIETTNQLVSQWIEASQAAPRAKYVLCIESPDSEFIGLIGMNMGKPGYSNAEIWYKLHPDSWNQGYATEAAREILRFCFEELRLHRVEAGCAVENIASIKVLEKIGMIREGRSRGLLPIRGQWMDNFVFAILESDFKN